VAKAAFQARLRPAFSVPVGVLEKPAFAFLFGLWGQFRDFLDNPILKNIQPWI